MNREQAPLRIKLYPSKRLILYQHLLHAALACYSLMVFVAYPLAILWPILVVIFSWVRLARVTRINRSTSSTIVWAPNGSWLVEHASGKVRHYPTLGSCFNLHWLTILGFREGWFRRRYYLLLGDNCDPQQYRRLRVRLKQQAGSG
ncbi:protein YgfX [Sedimenticola sp.]|uniref:protein YgfX n=1 Tax=Sedimenticola sp. TaxID=1940285 RepID=UPI003D104297